MALAAGVCEELIFRGFGLRVLNDLGLEGFALLGVSALIFGLAHIYQGPVGILATGAMGIALGMGYVTTGSLLWAMALHTALDLKVLLLGKVQEPQESLLTFNSQVGTGPQARPVRPIRCSGVLVRRPGD